MRRVVINIPEVGEWVSARAECPYNPKTDTVFGVVDPSKFGTPGWIRGGAVYTGYTVSAIWVHFAGVDEKWITHDMLWIAFDYPFRQLGCTYLYGMVDESKQNVVDIDLKFGFEITARLPGLFASGDGLVLSMHRDKCRWLNLKPRTFRQP